MGDTRKIIAYFDTTVEEYGYSVLDSHPHAKWVTGDLVVGGMEVRHTEHFKVTCGETIPVWLVARSTGNERNERGSFFCGVDLTESGQIWVGINRAYFDNPEDAWNYIREKEGDFYLSPEEPLRV